MDKSILDPKDRMIKLLFKQNKFQETGKMIRNMWYSRRAILKYRKDTTEGERSNGRSLTVMKSDPGPKRKTVIPVDREIKSISVSRG